MQPFDLGSHWRDFNENSYLTPHTFSTNDASVVAITPMEIDGRVRWDRKDAEKETALVVI
jgi:hypothetical protein